MKAPFVILIVVMLCASFPISVAAQERPEKVDFERHVMGVLSKTGCNLGSCHGSFQGKNGFRLSLFGYEPAMDYAGLTRDNLARRIDLHNPESSLLLLKATGAIAHEGGMRFGRDSWSYRIFRDWIAAGAKWTPGSGTITELQVTPSDYAVVPANARIPIKVLARFADGSAEDVTAFCDFRISDDAVATLSPTGEVTAHQPGDAGLTVVYRGAVQSLRVLVPAPAVKGLGRPADSRHPVDQAVQTKLAMLNMIPSQKTSDLEFLRRITIDTIGILPSPDEIRQFVADDSPDKRERKIDELLKHPLHSALWATKLSDITGNNTDALENPQNTKFRRSQMWHEWLRTRIADNMPYDEIVKGILTATSREGRSTEEWLKDQRNLDEQLEKGFDSDYAKRDTLDLFWRRQGQVPVEQWGEKVAAAFLGVRLECAQCHKHPTDRWTQADYWGFANLFSPVIFINNQASSPDTKKLIDAENKARREKYTGKNNNQLNVVRELHFTSNIRQAQPRAIPGTRTVVTPQALGGPEMPHRSGDDTREKLWEWMRNPENPFFARSFVNRVWAHYFGIGLVNPVDDFSQANAPTNPQLLHELSQAFIETGYDLRKLERLILTSDTYQRSAIPNESNQFDKNNFARSYVRPLMAEQVVDVLNSGIGVDEVFGNDVPAGRKMTEIGASRINNANLNYILRIFGRPPRTTACDCERAMEPALPQTLFRMTDPALMQKLRAPTNRAGLLARKKVSDEEAIEELFLATLSRFPSETEQAKAQEFIKKARTPLIAYQDILWALINTREFILNH